MTNDEKEAGLLGFYFFLFLGQNNAKAGERRRKEDFSLIICLDE